MTPTIPHRLKLHLQRLHLEFLVLYTRWIHFRQLFAHGPETIDLLNRVAPSFFGHLELVQLDHLAIGLSRITDRKQVARKDTLSLERLILDAAGHKGLVSELSSRLKTIKKAVKKIRDHRNQRVAHLDLVTAVSAISEVSLGFSRQTLSDTFNMISEFLNEIRQHFGEVPCGYDKTITQRGDAASLVSKLKMLPPVHLFRRAARLANASPDTR